MTSYSSTGGGCSPSSGGGFGRALVASLGLLLAAALYSGCFGNPLIGELVVYKTVMAAPTRVP